ncbi:uncharacterized protein F5891DRAFT_983313 [Suillus fuscotomentosus]|uniref:Uncharacterized protein n=1 Tax=Suillus fuscotomentosus TaxID=1912939 RepID=A0AAD4HIG8_9AGAM|nr:uncharacterized protein F5891DRAFT_983313 [Suillus fuscotomentosus]KAG1896714.1 hypothetical protein F5891DRAFT_983313 [Suillus fuscotomentosus]
MSPNLLYIPAVRNVLKGQIRRAWLQLMHCTPYPRNSGGLPEVEVEMPAVAGTLVEDDHADFASLVWNAPCGQSKSAAAKGLPWWVDQRRHCWPMPTTLDHNLTVVARHLLLAPQHSENPVVPTPAVPDIPNIPGTIQILPTSSTATDDVLRQEVQALCENELAEANHKLVQQQAHFDFITEELADHRWHMLLPPMVPPVRLCLRGQQLAEHEAATENLNGSADKGQPAVEQGDASAEQGECTSTGSEANV